MDIYEDEGVDALVDLRAAARELKVASLVSNEGSRRALIAEIQTAALLDIAYSLRAVAMEAIMAMPNPLVEYVDGPDEPNDGTSDAAAAARDFLVEGDLVTIENKDLVFEVLGFGYTEGSPYARIREVGDDVTESRVWLENLTRVPTPSEETLAEKTPDETVDETVVEPDEDPDDDFTGSAEAQSALDLLRANEAERKAKKKGTKK